MRLRWQRRVVEPILRTSSSGSLDGGRSGSRFYAERGNDGDDHASLSPGHVRVLKEGLGVLNVVGPNLEGPVDEERQSGSVFNVALGPQIGLELQPIASIVLSDLSDDPFGLDPLIVKSLDKSLICLNRASSLVNLGEIGEEQEKPAQGSEESGLGLIGLDPKQPGCADLSHEGRELEEESRRANSGNGVLGYQSLDFIAAVEPNLEIRIVSLKAVAMGLANGGVMEKFAVIPIGIDQPTSVRSRLWDGFDEGPEVEHSSLRAEILAESVVESCVLAVDLDSGWAARVQASVYQGVNSSLEGAHAESRRSIVSESSMVLELTKMDRHCGHGAQLSSFSERDLRNMLKSVGNLDEENPKMKPQNFLKSARTRRIKNPASDMSSSLTGRIGWNILIILMIHQLVRSFKSFGDIFYTIHRLDAHDMPHLAPVAVDINDQDCDLTVSQKASASLLRTETSNLMQLQSLPLMVAGLTQEGKIMRFVDMVCRSRLQFAILPIRYEYFYSVENIIIQYFLRKLDSDQFVTDSKEIMVHSDPAKILIGLSLDAEVSKEILSWTIGVLARPNDTVIALHVLVEKGEKKQLESITIDKTRFRRAKAFVIFVLGDFAEICQEKQVNLEARVEYSSSIGRGLVEEAKSIGAHFLLVGGSRNQSQRTSLSITKYCFKHAPDGCSVVSIGTCGKPHQDSESEIIPFEDFHQWSSRGSDKDNHIGKAISSLHKLYSSNKRRNRSNQHSPTESISEKPSPRTVLDGPEGGSQGIEEDSCSTLGDSSFTESPSLVPQFKGRSNIWKHLSMFKLFFPFLRSPLNGTSKEINEGLFDKENWQPSWRCFSYEEISNATNNFHPDNMVGRGGYAEVYRGDLCDGQTIAVKRLAKDNTDENKEKEFLTELGIVGHVCHPNTTHLIGCCIENGFHLIFNFSPNGSLASALHGRTCRSLEWPTRYKIAIGVARGLHYLHKCCKRRIIHRDIKASNVLLGPDLDPQISDFGLAKWLPKQWTHHAVMMIEGTFGYLAPEYFMHGIVDEKTDVFAFGVLLLEIITGRRPVDSSKQNLLLWAKPLIESGDMTELADPNLGGQYNVEQMRRVVLTASYCVLQLLTDSHDSEIAQSWRMLKYEVDEMDVDLQFSTNDVLQDEEWLNSSDSFHL
ncbi:hypothetical protein HHK36_013683 [Tetracentron sinense]|uniref:Protein kinase domain-containing protein n=1 Tax=Tetracentron sinense TaxID=13715 RepID=A0A834Z4K6_TETSI|nr:hypothetical protein HHK36_013683 [Tetracentron sinense]